jgi:uncharacterized protein involved in cysteine biosynthesis
MGMIGDFLRAVGQLFDARFTGVLLRSVALTLGLLVGLSLGAVWLVGLLPESFDLPLIGEVATPFSAARGLALGAMTLLSAFLMFPVAAIFVNLYLDRIVDAVEARHYPELAAVRPMGLAEALKGGVGFALVVLGVNLVAMIFYLISGPFAPLVADGGAAEHSAGQPDRAGGGGGDLHPHVPPAEAPQRSDGSVTKLRSARVSQPNSMVL